jgi:hypothetical protein
VQQIEGNEYEPFWLPAHSWVQSLEIGQAALVEDHDLAVDDC